jgi:hypothetical protein
MDKSRLTNHPILDSILEYRSLGYTSEWMKWYFTYDETNRLLSSKRLYYNANLIFENITETRNYNSEGQMIRFVDHKPGTFLFDTVATDVYIEENQFENGKLIHKSVTNNDNFSFEDRSLEEYFTYNDNNQLILRTIIYPAGSSIFNSRSDSKSETEYYYNTGNELKFEYTTSTNGDYISYNLVKYDYQYSDTSKLSTIYNYQLSDKLEVTQFDSILEWYYCETYFETFDSQERRKTITHTRYFSNKPLTGLIDFHAEYKYSGDDQLLHASYYNWVVESDSGSWSEAMRIDNSFDEDGKILFYIRTFYDDRTADWAIDEQKTYYYSYQGKSTGADKLTTKKLSIFPNPANDFITLENLQGRASTYKLFNLSGKQVGSGRIENRTITIAHLKPGIYIMKIENIKSGYSGRFVKY